MNIGLSLDHSEVMKIAAPMPEGYTYVALASFPAGVMIIIAGEERPLMGWDYEEKEWRGLQDNGRLM